MFVVMEYSLSFYSLELEHVNDVKLYDLVDGLRECTQFKPLSHSQKGTYIMLAHIGNMEKILA